MQKLDGFQILLVNDSKPTWKAWCLGGGRSQNQYVVIMQDLSVLALGGVLLWAPTILVVKRYLFLHHNLLYSLDL